MTSDLRIWITKLNQKVEAKTGFQLKDLPDLPYADWHKQGVSIKDAVKRVIFQGFK